MRRYPKLLRATLTASLMAVATARVAVAGAWQDFEGASAAYKNGDYATAARLLRPLAEQGYVPAQSLLGVLYDQGQGVQQDYVEAMKWYRLAADRGYTAAQYLLGILYDQGQGVPKDYTEAMKWYRLAADQGYAPARNSVGVLYARGEFGVGQNWAEAVRWYRLAADQGYALAQQNLGNMYLIGAGVPQDNVQALMWFILAASQGDFEAGTRDTPDLGRDYVASGMTPAQIAEAQKLAREWKPKPER